MNAREIAMRCMVLLAVCTFGSLNTGTALLTASIPVYVPAPMLYEWRIIKSNPANPISDVILWTSVIVLFTTVGILVRWIKKAYIIAIAWVITNNANIGTKDNTDSFIPLKFNRIITIITKNANPNLNICQLIDRKLNMA